MRTVFADTLFFVARFNRRDQHHAAAIAFLNASAAEIVTTEYVLMEVANFFSKPDMRPVFVLLMETLEEDPLVRILPSSSDLFANGLALFAARPDKEWSLTDCTSFEVMRELGLTNALTADQHFAQAGFVPLLAAAP